MYKTSTYPSPVYLSSPLRISSFALLYEFCLSDTLLGGVRRGAGAVKLVLVLRSFHKVIGTAIELMGKWRRRD